MKELIREILEVTKSEQSISFYKKAISVLGNDRIRAVLTDLKLSIREGNVDDPAKLFNYWVSELLPKKEDRYIFETFKNRDDLYEKLSLKKEEPEISFIELPNRKNAIERPLLLSKLQFFTLSSYEKKSDEISVKIKTQEGEIEGTLVRGRTIKGAKEEGILTAFEGRVFDALLNIWKDRGCPVGTIKLDKYDKPHLSGVINFSVSEIARKLGFKFTGGRVKFIIVNALRSLYTKPYCLYVKAGDQEQYHGFQLLGNFSITGIKRGKQTEKTGITVTLSPEITTQYYHKHHLPFSKEILRVKSELAYLLWQYVEPIIEARKGIPDQRATLKLIEDLHLPPATWHPYKSLRKQNFDIALRALAEIKTAKENPVRFQWVGEVDDWVIRFGYASHFPKELPTKPTEETEAEQ